MRSTDSAMLLLTVRYLLQLLGAKVMGSVVTASARTEEKIGSKDF